MHETCASCEEVIEEDRIVGSIVQSPRFAHLFNRPTFNRSPSVSAMFEFKDYGDDVNLLDELHQNIQEYTEYGSNDERLDDGDLAF